MPRGHHPPDHTLEVIGIPRRDPFEVARIDFHGEGDLVGVYRVFIGCLEVR